MEEKNLSNLTPAIWAGKSGKIIPPSAKDPEQIIVLAQSLSTKQQDSVVNAIKNDSFEMAAEFVWKRSIARLQLILQSLGMKFIGEMLGRADIDEFSTIENVLTEYSTLKLSEQLGLFNSTGSFRLRQSLEIINHFVQKSNEESDNTEELGYIDAMSIVKNCVQYVLGEQNITVAIEFHNLRDRLLTQQITLSDPQVQQLINSPSFYLSTAITVILTSIKEDKGARLEHALSNLNALIPALWKNLPEKDKWNLGNIYRDTIAAGNNIASNGIKSALLKVEGFDYVPETLRSSTFSKIAAQIIDAHFSHNNFYSELPLVQSLAKLGTIIPRPAFLDCVQAYLAVYLGNRYGVSFSAAPVAEEQLLKIQEDRWQYYFSKALQDDDIILYKLTEERPASRFISLFHRINKGDVYSSNKLLSNLIKNLINGNLDGVTKSSRKILNDSEN